MVAIVHWLSMASLLAFVLLIFFFLPLSLWRSTRGFAALAILCCSYVFGITLWMEGLAQTYTLWGVPAVIVGLFLAGVGVVPIAMLATLVNGLWMAFAELLCLAVVTLGTRVIALKIAGMCRTNEAVVPV